jgi:YD repeat-containing protein
VTGDIVLDQTENFYDENGNLIKTTTRERFHDATGTGELGSPTSGIGARVSYMGYYFDLADRPIASIDVGTNGGSTWTRPASLLDSANLRSDTVLRTDTSYDTAGRAFAVTDPRGLVSETFYDVLGRTVKTIENVPPPAPPGPPPPPTPDQNKTTEYTYGPAGQTTLKAWTSATTYEITKWIYGVTQTTGGSDITSNDILSAVQYPDPVTGLASSSQQETYYVNALGDTISKHERTGTIHTYYYDVLGRKTADAARLCLRRARQ